MLLSYLITLTQVDAGHQKHLFTFRIFGLFRLKLHLLDFYSTFIFVIIINTVCEFRYNVFRTICLFLYLLFTKKQQKKNDLNRTD